MANGRKIVTPVFRASFVYVFTPRKNEQSGKDEYSIKMIFDKDADLSDLKAIIKEAIADKWGSNPPRGLKLPLKDGNAGDTEKYPEDKDKFISLIFKHTTTRGLRYSVRDRNILASSTQSYTTSIGDVRIKTSTGFGISKSKYEYDDLRKLALNNNISIKEVISTLNNEIKPAN